MMLAEVLRELQDNGYINGATREEILEKVGNDGKERETEQEGN